MSQIKTILVPVDFSKNAKIILRHAVSEAEKSAARLVVVYVVEDLEKYSALSIPHISFAELEKDLLRGAEHKMESFLEENLDESVAHTSKILYGDVAEQINSFAKSEGVDLIVIGTHGYKGLERVLFGSVAEKVVKTAPCPVVTINPYR
ncbi:MAG: universal stress protein [Desulfobacterales bacterium]|nr:universal stress protein [Desulfobacterales bacterium]